MTTMLVVAAVSVVVVLYSEEEQARVPRLREQEAVKEDIERPRDERTAH